MSECTCRLKVTVRTTEPPPRTHSASRMSDLPQSDVSRPSKLPTANLLPQGAAPPAADQNSDEYLDAVEEDWNKKVDAEIETLADGMVDLVNLASVRSCD